MSYINVILDQLKSFLKLITVPIFELGDSKISVTSVLIAVLIVVISVRISKILGQTVKKNLVQRSIDSGVADSIARFVRYAIIAAGTMLSLDTLGFSVSSLAALGAVLMVGIGFGLQNIAQNFVSGLILLIERPVKVGDIVHVGNTAGRIVDIHVRSTIIQTLDDVTVIVPNSKFISEEVINDSYTGNNIRRHIKIGVAYGSNIEQVKKLLIDQAYAHPLVLKDPPPSVVFEDFGESSLNFDLRFWTELSQDKDVIGSDIRCGIDASFRAHGIEIPFPQRDLHLKSGLPPKLNWDGPTERNDSSRL